MLGHCSLPEQSLSALGEDVPEESSLFPPTTKLRVFLHNLEPQERGVQVAPLFFLLHLGWRELCGCCHG